jgi:uncharacterized membrane protein YGL010W
MYLICLYLVSCVCLHAVCHEGLISYIRKEYSNELNFYQLYHRHPMNILIHKICVPLELLSLLSLLHYSLGVWFTHFLCALLVGYIYLCSRYNVYVCMNACIFMCVCIYSQGVIALVCVYVCMWCMCVHACAYLWSCLCKYLRIYICMYMYVII